MAAPVKITQVMSETHHRGTGAVKKTRVENISHLANEERLSGGGCLSVSGAETQQTQALHSILRLKKTGFFIRRYEH